MSTSHYQETFPIETLPNPGYIEIAVSSFEQAKRLAEWGTYGKNGNEPLRWVRLIDCSTEHLENILRTQPQIRGHIYQRIIKSILNDRD